MADDTLAVSSNDYMEQELRSRVVAFGDVVEADVLTYVGPIYTPIDDYIRYAIEDMSTRKSRLAVVLETHGGYIETAERVAGTFRRHHAEVWFFVPNFAMSAGTVLVMSGDRIFMDYYSILGPIDPQVESKEGNFVPALGYLVKFDDLIKKDGTSGLSTAEITYLIERFDPAELYAFEQARDLSVDLLKEWLVKYKFKDWKVTETRKKKVTKAMRKARANMIAKKLNDTKRWKSHARGLPMELIKRDLNLKIDDFGADKPVDDALQAYYKLLKDYMARRGHTLVIHKMDNYFGLRIQ